MEPRSRLLENVIASQLVKILPAFYSKKRFRCRLHYSPPWVIAGQNIICYLNFDPVSGLFPFDLQLKYC
jgi:hypothetical protein